MRFLTIVGPDWSFIGRQGGVQRYVADIVYGDPAILATHESFAARFYAILDYADDAVSLEYTAGRIPSFGYAAQAHETEADARAFLAQVFGAEVPTC